MATTRSATTIWHGSLMEGAGHVVQLESSGLGGFDVTWASRAEDPAGRTSPEELIGTAHSSCFSMALSNASPRGTPPKTLRPCARPDAPSARRGDHRDPPDGARDVPGITSGESPAAAGKARRRAVRSVRRTPTTITLHGNPRLTCPSTAPRGTRREQSAFRDSGIEQLRCQVEQPPARSARCQAGRHGHRAGRTPHRHLSVPGSRCSQDVVDRVSRNRSVLRRTVLRGLQRRRLRARVHVKRQTHRMAH